MIGGGGGTDMLLWGTFPKKLKTPYDSAGLFNENLVLYFELTVKFTGGGRGGEYWGMEPKLEDWGFGIGAWYWGLEKVSEESPNKLLNDFRLEVFDWGWPKWTLEIGILELELGIDPKFKLCWFKRDEVWANDERLAW